MAKSDARFEYQARLNREIQDLQVKPKGFTTTCGMLNPIFADFASPGDKYYITHTLDFLRTAPLAAPAMCDVKVHYESFFVPIQMLFQPFEQAYFSITDVQSSFFDSSRLQNMNLPVLNYEGYCTGVRGTSDSDNYHADAFRFADLLGLNPFNFITHFKNFQYFPNFFPWQALAYHAIYNYVYRLDDKIQFSNLNFNWDRFYDASYSIDYGSTSGLFTIYQRPWDFDYFTSMYSSPIVSGNNMQNLLPTDKYSDLVSQYTSGINASGSAINSNPTRVAFASYVGGTYSQQEAMGGISTAMIRQMFANEKLAMITGRTRKTYDSQVLAHFGISVPHDPKHDIARIGHDVYTMRVAEVTSLANTADTALGDLAGKGYASSYRQDGEDTANKHEFVAPCHGVVMTIFSIEPLKRYYGGFARQNAVSKVFDFPVPEFDRLGNQPVYRYEIGNVDAIGPDHEAQLYFMTDIIGWNKRYQQWKNRPSTCTLAFMSGLNNSINEWQSYMISSFPFAIIKPSITMTPYAVESRPDLASRFLIDRHAVDGLMLQPFAEGWKSSEQGENWNYTPWLVYARDPFIVDSHEVVKKVSWMSKDGEPIYNY